MPNKLKNLSQQTKKDADLLLKRTELLAFLKNYGEVYIRGSYELDLMMAGDIDIYVINKKINKNLAIKALNELILQNQFRGYLFYDFVKRRKKGFLQGYYIGLKTKFKGKKWKVDVWLMKSMDNISDRFMKKILPQLNTEKRNTILKLKLMVKEKQLPIASHLIYRAVLEKNAENVKQLNDFIKNIK
jgi:hypothetical protein